ncbi:uncharacterized protein [Triticum aestivum]|uniref:uncharacterized protein n=1 Tax=Triticum aestivum TaxID=4565 RepID=UPI001D02697E|nr:uncharacterized protein LOC123090145 [Triticum aestivum]
MCRGGGWPEWRTEREGEAGAKPGARRGAIQAQRGEEEPKLAPTAASLGRTEPNTTNPDWAGDYYPDSQPSGGGGASKCGGRRLPRSTSHPASPLLTPSPRPPAFAALPAAKARGKSASALRSPWLGSPCRAVGAHHGTSRPPAVQPPWLRQRRISWMLVGWAVEVEGGSSAGAAGREARGGSGLPGALQGVKVEVASTGAAGARI